MRKGKREKIEINISSTSISHPVLLRTNTGVALEVVAEEGGAGEVVFVGKVGQGVVGLQEVEAYLHDGVDVDGLFWGLSVMALFLMG